MDIVLLKEIKKSQIREITITTSTGAQFLVAEGRDGSLTVSAGLPLATEQYSFGMVVIRQQVGEWGREGVHPDPDLWRDNG